MAAAMSSRKSVAFGGATALVTFMCVFFVLLLLFVRLLLCFCAMAVGGATALRVLFISV
jgi:hypothetical protein